MTEDIIVGVLGIALNKEGKYLQTLRYDPEYYDVHEKWQLPGGGMEFGETAEETLLRELREEIGVEAKILYPYPIVQTQTWEVSRKHVVLIAYLVDIGDQAITLNEEATEYKWVTAAEIKEMPLIVNNEHFITKAEDLVQEHDLLSQLG